MKKLSRRAFFCLAPASVGAIALGAAVLTKRRRPGSYLMKQVMWDKWFRDIRAMSETTLLASEDPPLMVSDQKVAYIESMLDQTRRGILAFEGYGGK